MRRCSLPAILLALILLTASGPCFAAGASAPAAPARAELSPTSSTAARKFTFVIVHGAWGGGWAFKKVQQLLNADGHTVYRPTLTGQGERVHLASPEVGLETHIIDVVNTILYEDLHDIVLVGHSYGGMVVTGVADRIPDRIGHIIYLDACLPENGENLSAVLGHIGRPSANGFITITSADMSKKPPHDVPQSAKTFSDPVVLKNQDAVRKIPTTYILTVDPGRQPQNDTFYPCYQRAKARGWKMEIMEADHNPQWSKPEELAHRLEAAPSH